MSHVQISRHRPHHRVAAAAAASLSVMVLTALPSSARQDAGDPAPSTLTEHCMLARVGDQFVRCDDLTGNGVPAPGWVPER